MVMPEAIGGRSPKIQGVIRTFHITVQMPGQLQTALRANKLGLQREIKVLEGDNDLVGRVRFEQTVPSPGQISELKTQKKHSSR